MTMEKGQGENFFLGFGKTLWPLQGRTLVCIHLPYTGPHFLPCDKGRPRLGEMVPGPLCDVRKDSRLCVDKQTSVDPIDGSRFQCNKQSALRCSIASNYPETQTYARGDL